MEISIWYQCSLKLNLNHTVDIAEKKSGEVVYQCSLKLNLNHTKGAVGSFTEIIKYQCSLKLNLNHTKLLKFGAHAFKNVSMLLKAESESYLSGAGPRIKIKISINAP